MSEPKWTKGPWGWFGNNHGIYLATPDRGRIFVMGFERYGMQGAQPTFGRNHIMVPASELVRFAVGDGTARGFAAGKKDPSVYRYDITAIDHPVAHLIAAAPDLYEALERAVAAMENIMREDYPDWDGSATKPGIIADARAALSKARGE